MAKPASQQTGRPVARRTFLRGAGAAVALPWIPSIAGESSLPPVRLGFLFMPNGVLPSAWQVSGEGRTFELSPTLTPLGDLRKRSLVLSGLCNKNSRAGEGHYVKTTALLSGAPVHKTGGRDLRVGTSVDQVAAQAKGHETPLPSLELSLEPVRNKVDMGYSTVYGAHISWRTPEQPASREIHPRLAWDRMFRAGRLAKSCPPSVLDVIRGDARRLTRSISAEDRGKVDEYLVGLRTLERRIARFGERQLRGAEAVAKGARPGADFPDDYPEHARLMLELIAQAFVTDSTRVASLMFGNAVSSRDFTFLDGVDGGYHPLSHHENDEEKQAQYALINRWHVEQLSWLARRLAASPEGDGSVLDSTALLFGSGLRDGDRHDPSDLPLVLVGDGGGYFEVGQHLRSEANTPLCHLYVDMLRAFGVASDAFGDAEGPLPGAARG